MIDIARTGGGVGIFPEPMVRAELASGSLVEIGGMPALAPVEFHVAMRVSDSEPVLGRIFDRAGICLADNQPACNVAIYVEELRQAGRRGGSGRRLGPCSARRFITSTLLSPAVGLTASCSMQCSWACACQESAWCVAMVFLPYVAPIMAAES